VIKPPSKRGRKRHSVDHSPSKRVHRIRTEISPPFVRRDYQASLSRVEVGVRPYRGGRSKDWIKVKIGVTRHGEGILMADRH
jgi:hypothetical protein